MRNLQTSTKLHEECTPAQGEEAWLEGREGVRVCVCVCAAWTVAGLYRDSQRWLSS